MQIDWIPFRIFDPDTFPLKLNAGRSSDLAEQPAGGDPRVPARVAFCDQDR
jgi:hypothetical protein